MARHSLLAVLASLVLAGSIATVVVRSDDSASTTDPVVAATEEATDAQTSEPAPAGDDSVAPAPDEEATPEPAPSTPDADNVVNAGDIVEPDEPAAPDTTVDTSDPVVAVESMPNTGGGMLSLLGAGVALGALATGRRKRD